MGEGGSEVGDVAEGESADFGRLVIHCVPIRRPLKRGLKEKRKEEKRREEEEKKVNTCSNKCFRGGRL